MPTRHIVHDSDPLTQTRAWVDHAVIGLNLCPFAKAVQAKGQVRYVLSETHEPEALLATLCDEMNRLVATDPAEIDTTLVVHPNLLTDFLDFNDFLGIAEDALAERGLEGVLQLASFHPQFQFAGTGA